jgi:hypothetical protein
VIGIASPKVVVAICTDVDVVVAVGEVGVVSLSVVVVIGAVVNGCVAAMVVVGVVVENGASLGAGADNLPTKSQSVRTSQ